MRKNISKLIALQLFAKILVLFGTIYKKFKIDWMILNIRVFLIFRMVNPKCRKPLHLKTTYVTFTKYLENEVKNINY